MITEDYISFETAKLLKEKGFDELCSCFYFINGARTEARSYVHRNSQSDFKNKIACPTLQMVMKWLREVHNLEIYPYHNNPIIINSKWWVEVIKYPSSVCEYESRVYEESDTYEEVCEVAINYCLKHLI